MSGILQCVLGTFLQKTRPKNANGQGRDELQTRSDIIAKRTAAEGRVRCGKATTRDVGLPECVDVPVKSCMIYALKRPSGNNIYCNRAETDHGRRAQKS